MRMEGKQLLIAGCLLSGLGVALGAAGSHALKDVLSQYNRTDTFEIAVRYQLYHGLALLLIGLLSFIFKEINFSLVGWFILTGVILFSGSLYVLSLSSIRWVVFITPLGGVMLVGGWLILLMRLVKIQK